MEEDHSVDMGIRFPFCFTSSVSACPGGGGGTAIYGLYRYVPL